MDNVDDDLDFNAAGVGRRGARVVILKWRAEMSTREAVNLAAWLVALGDADADDEFKRILEAARNS